MRWVRAQHLRQLRDGLSAVAAAQANVRAQDTVRHRGAWASTVDRASRRAHRKLKIAATQRALCDGRVKIGPYTTCTFERRLCLITLICLRERACSSTCDVRAHLFRKLVKVTLERCDNVGVTPAHLRKSRTKVPPRRRIAVGSRHTFQRLRRLVGLPVAHERRDASPRRLRTAILRMHVASTQKSEAAQNDEP